LPGKKIADFPDTIAFDRSFANAEGKNCGIA